MADWANTLPWYGMQALFFLAGGFVGWKAWGYVQSLLRSFSRIADAAEALVSHGRLVARQARRESSGEWVCATHVRYGCDECGPGPSQEHQCSQCGAFPSEYGG